MEALKYEIIDWNGDGLVIQQPAEIQSDSVSDTIEPSHVQNAMMNDSYAISSLFKWLDAWKIYSRVIESWIIRRDRTIVENRKPWKWI